MAEFVLIESRDPSEFTTVNHFYRRALDLHEAGHNVTLFLVQNGVMPARKSVKADRLAELAAKGVTILADEFSLKQRAIEEDELLPEARIASLDIIASKMAAGAKTAWH
jgi:predicted peroxiredoxin